MKAESPVWHCHNAFKLDQKCCYALCSKCYMMLEERKQETRKRTSNINTRTSNKRARCAVDKDKNKQLCDHHNLQAQTDIKYFEPNYLERLADEDTPKTHYPFSCVECKKTIHS